MASRRNLPDTHITRALRKSTRDIKPGALAEPTIDLPSSQEDHRVPCSPPRRRTNRDEQAFEAEPDSSQDTHFTPSQEDKEALDIFTEDVVQPGSDKGYPTDDDRVMDDGDGDDTAHSDSQDGGHTIAEDDTSTVLGNLQSPQSSQSSYYSDDAGPEPTVLNTVFTQREMHRLQQAFSVVASPQQMGIVKEAIRIFINVEKSEMDYACRHLDVRQLEIGAFEP